MTKRRMIILFGSLLFALAGCSATEPSGPAVTLPHTVATAGPFHFVLGRDQEHWHVSAACSDSAAAQDATSLLVRIASATGATEGSATFEEPVACTEGQPPLLRVESAVKTLQPGERLEVSARVEYPQQATAITQCYAMGRGGVLHETSATAGCLANE